MEFFVDPNNKPGIEILPDDKDETDQLADILAESFPGLFQELEMYNTVLIQEKGLADDVLEQFQVSSGSIAGETAELHSAIEQAWR